MLKEKKLYMCFVDMEWAMGKNGIPEILVRSVMSLYEGAKTRVRVDSELSQVFWLKWRFTTDLCYYLYLLQWWYVVTEFISGCAK